MATNGKLNPELSFAESIREACVRAAIDGYENASICGLCAEGAFESAISAIRMLDLEKLTKQHAGADD